MTLDDATSDSKCVGRFETPLCAVETTIACFARGKNDLCSQARLTGSADRLTSGNIGYRTGERYRVVRVERLTGDSILDIPREIGRLQAGDIRIDIISGGCFRTDSGRRYCSRPFSDPNIYTVRKTPAGWKIVDWGMPDIRWPGRKIP
ncbi:MAG: hypothetical protein GC202_12200 [Alphaproteobacteria bacterium]|nr:hypothetical protein [Alphaproteobacteria bacterium]